MIVHEYPNKMIRKEQYTTGELAILFGIAQRTACNMVDDGDFASFKIGRSKQRRVLYTTIVAYCEKFAPQYQHVLDKFYDPEPRKSKANQAS